MWLQVEVVFVLPTTPPRWLWARVVLLAEGGLDLGRPRLPLAGRGTRTIHSGWLIAAIPTDWSIE